MSAPTIVAELDGGPERNTFPRTAPRAIDWIAEVPEPVVMLLPPGGDTSAPAEQWEKVTAGQLRERVRSIARGLVAMGLEHGDRMCLMSRTRHEWTLLSWGAAYVGVALVPVYETSAPAQVEWIVTDSGARLFVVESAQLRVSSGVDELPAEVRPPVLVIDEGALATIEKAGASVDDATLDARAAAVTKTDLLTIVYTSGTTGNPKGCAASHGGFLLNIDDVLAVLGPQFEVDGARTVLMLPLAHIFGRLIEATTLLSRHTLVHEPDMAHVAQAFAIHRPTHIGSVPRVFEKVHASAVASAKAKGGAATRLFTAAEKVAMAWGSTDSPSPALRVKHAVFDRLVYRKLRAALGGECSTIVSGGSALSPDLIRFFRGVGFEILEGYGLTEAAVSTVNVPGRSRTGTVGPPLPSVRVGITDTGEVLLRTPQAVMGYWNNPAATEAAFAGGWFHTGDLGSIEDGCLKITGRAKEIIVTAGGKNVAPIALEDALTRHPLIGQALVVGENRPFIAALLTLDAAGSQQWADAEGIAPGTDLTTHPRVLELIGEHVAQVNTTVSRAESIREWRVVPGEWTPESGDLTPTMKMKRSVISTRAKDVIEEMYSDRRP